MDQPPPLQTFRLLTEEEFKALTTAVRAEYLKRAIAVRNSINRQVDGFVVAVLPEEKKN
jgi:hypothetical protein